MEITLETIVFSSYSLYHRIFHLDGNDPPHGALGHLPCCSVLSVQQASTFLLGYTFLGSVQIMVYAGGIVVLYVFSMFCNCQWRRRCHREVKERGSSREQELRWAISSSNSIHHFEAFSSFATTDVEPLEVNIKTIGHHMLSGSQYGYLLPFGGQHLCWHVS